MKIATWNVNSLRVRLPQVLDWLDSVQPGVLAVQETKLTDDAFPVEALRAVGYHAVYSGQKTYNGVAVLSKAPVEDVLTDPPNLDDPQRRILAVTAGPLRIINLYVPNGSEVGSDKYAYKLDWLAKVRDFIAEEMAAHPHTVVLGDFNIAPEDRDVHDPESWREKILCSTPERDAFRAWAGLGLSDLFRRFEQPEGSFSWWDYRAAGFRRNLGLRIDHILASLPLAGRCTACSIDKTPRSLERPSDHAPVIAEFDGF
ncbi:exodeoxyribonuclease III [Methylococcus capsulatus str. Bath]|jgi:exodeoxyribonuclease-3|uniref:Exodeoxyribonuclease III n=1 Tax=Methylococcus capsulatus (strain ATCC 33009 / NCIMB 11132 / Bath) TaxID=243233 RepID=Q602J3_METCA|nr:exodeoxyribonuclease III [Methylococcus capsulatus]AAU90862.1 exodeoxyribonuclease III [Methylococcus capsulatus str. Bath]